jgi:EmrB/QacA subfamily drug resistance transporter
MVAAPATPRPRWALVVAILGSGMAFLDQTVVNVALPVMQRNLGATVGQMQWIVEAYALLLSALVLVGGALGDRLGRRKIFLAGVALFALASAGCGAAPSVEWLIAARAVQGVGAALLVPGSLALISAAYSEKTRGAAIGAWSSWSAITAAVGPVAGGWVVSHASWRWLFFFNVPVAAAVISLGSRRVAETRDPEAPPRLDLAGAALATVGLGLVVFALIDAGQTNRLGTPRTLLPLGLGALTLVAFLVLEARRAAPMVPLGLFRSRTFSGANLLTLLLYAAMGAAMFFIPFNLIQVQRYAPAAAGAALLPLVFLISGLSPGAGALAARIGARPLLVAGPSTAAVGFVLLAFAGTEGSYWRGFFPGITVLGLGMGLTVAPLTSAVMGALDPRHAGVASGINNAVARTAALLAIAALGLFLIARFGRALDHALAPLALPPDAAAVVARQRDRLLDADFSAVAPRLRAPLQAAFASAYVAGFRALMLASAALAALAAATGLALIGKTKTD